MAIPPRPIGYEPQEANRRYADLLGWHADLWRRHSELQLELEAYARGVEQYRAYVDEAARTQALWNEPTALIGVLTMPVRGE